MGVPSTSAALARRLRRAATSVPRVVVASTLAFGSLLGLYSVAVPLNESPDEPGHIALVFHLAQGGRNPAYDGLPMGAAALALCQQTSAATAPCPVDGEEPSFEVTRHRRAADAPLKSARPTYTQLGGDTPAGPLVEIAQHPPLYYQAMSWIVRVERALVPNPWPFGREVALVRLANAFLLLWLPLLIWVTARHLGLTDEIGAIGGLVPFAIPQLLHIGSSVNNDNLLVVLCAGIVALLAGVVRGDRSMRTAIALGVVAGLGLLTKAFAVLFLPVIVLAYVVGRRHHRPDETGADQTKTRRQIALALGSAGTVAAAVAGWWFVGNRLRTGYFTPTTADDRLRVLRPAGFHTDVLGYLSEFGAFLASRFWGWFGWFSVRISIVAVTAATIVMVGLLVVGVVAAPDAPTRRRGGGAEPPVRRSQVAVLLAPLGVLAAFVLQHAWSLYVLSGQTPFIQGRYLFGAVAGAAVGAAVGARRLFGRWAIVAIGVWALGMQAVAIARIIPGYWGSVGVGPADQVRAMVAWSPWPGELIGAAILTLAGTVLYLGFEIMAVMRGATSISTRDLIEDAPGPGLR